VVTGHWKEAHIKVREFTFFQCEDTYPKNGAFRNIVPVLAGDNTGQTIRTS
jgi:hypothetical protein